MMNDEPSETLQIERDLAETRALMDGAESFAERLWPAKISGVGAHQAEITTSG